jgi:hypothetical protein
MGNHKVSIRPGGKSAFVLKVSKDALRIRFLSSRTTILTATFLWIGVAVTPAIFITKFGWKGVGAFSLWTWTFTGTLSGLLVLIPRISRNEISIDADTVRVQRTWFHIPLGAPDIYPRNMLSDFGAFLQKYKGYSAPRCVLSVCYQGKTIELEREFPTDSLRQIKWELARRDISFAKRNSNDQSDSGIVYEA